MQKVGRVWLEPALVAHPASLGVSVVRILECNATEPCQQHHQYNYCEDHWSLPYGAEGMSCTLLGAR